MAKKKHATKKHATATKKAAVHHKEPKAHKGHIGVELVAIGRCLSKKGMQLYHAYVRKGSDRIYLGHVGAKTQQEAAKRVKRFVAKAL